MTDYDYKKRWVILGNLLEEMLHRPDNPLRFRDTTIKDVLGMMTAIHNAESAIKHLEEEGFKNV